MVYLQLLVQNLERGQKDTKKAQINQKKEWENIEENKLTLSFDILYIHYYRNESITMTELTKEHFHLHDSNKAKAYEDQKEMRKELRDFISECKVFELQKLYEEMKRFKR